MKLVCFFVVALGMSGQDISRARLFELLKADGTLDPHRRLVHLSQACSVRVEGKLYPVVDVQEIVKGAVTPRGVNRIVVLDGTKVVQALEYSTQRPLFCEGARLFVYGDLKIGNVGPEGNVLTFGHGAKEVSLSHVEANDYPVAETGGRKVGPQ